MVEKLGESTETQRDVKVKIRKKKVFVIRRSIFRIFILFSMIGMCINMFLLMFGLCFWQLLIIIDHGARPPTMLNIAIMSEAGATISRDGLAQ